MSIIFDRLLKILYIIVGGIILLSVFIGPFLTSSITYALSFIQWNLIILLVFFFLLGGAWLLVGLCRQRFNPLRHPIRWLAGVMGAVFVLSIPWIESFYFKTGWDVSMVISTAEALSRHATSLPDWILEYFSLYPNNLMITVLFSKILAVSSYFFLLVFQSALNTLAGFLVGLVILRWTHRQSLMWLGVALYIALISLSPWTSIPYSDATGLIFPISLLALYQSLGSRRLWGLKVIAMAFCFILGYLIKPQSAIVMIAIIVVTLAYTGYRYWKESLLFLAMSALLFIGAKSFVKVDVLPLDANKEISITHFLKMGLNDVTDGGFYAQDVDASRSAATPSERRQENLETVVKRVKNYGTLGLLRHQLRKTIVNYADGTFGWGLEGSFYAETHENHSFLARISRSLYYLDYRLYPLFQIWMQGWWLVVLTLACLSMKQKKLTPTQRVVYLALIGLFLFESLFEARARYLYTYAPLFIITAVSTIDAWMSPVDRSAGHVNYTQTKKRVTY